MRFLFDCTSLFRNYQCKTSDESVPNSKNNIRYMKRTSISILWERKRKHSHFNRAIISVILISANKSKAKPWLMSSWCARAELVFLVLTLRSFLPRLFSRLTESSRFFSIFFTCLFSFYLKL